MRRRRAVLIFILGAGSLMFLGASLPAALEQAFRQDTPEQQSLVHEGPTPALDALDQLSIKGRAPKTGYQRTEFGNGWSTVQGCSMRQVILHRDLDNITLSDECTVASGTLNDPYTGTAISYVKDQSARVQIDHVVALSDAWQKGAQLLTKEQRIVLANDPLELIAADGPSNQKKGDGDAASWLPDNKAFRCSYVARQIAVKSKYALWVTQAEYGAIKKVLDTCPQQSLQLE